jgi:hypothetical protein
MLRMYKLALLCLVAAIALLGAGCGRAKRSIEQGSVSGNTYTNDFFKLSIEYPLGWQVASQESKRAAERAGTKAVTGNAPAGAKRSIEGSVQRTFYLLMASQRPVGSPGPLNANLVVLAENLSPMPSIKTGRDYLAATKQTLSLTGIPTTIDKEPYEYVVNGETMYRMDLTMTLPQAGGVPIHEALIVTVRDGYGIGVTLTWADPQTLQLMEQSVQTLRFR